MIHQWEPVMDIILSGRFASIGLYEKPSMKDHERAVELLDAVQKMCVIPEGPALIYITHHIEEIIPEITHALALRKGRVIASGKRCLLIKFSAKLLRYQ